MADIQTNFAIAIIGMTIVCVILMGIPIAFMLANSFRMRRRTNVPTR
jgi:ABC-type spermidine/putrescine transport system permease subunit II